MSVRVAFDDITAGNVPPGGDLYMGYDDGQWPDAAAIAARFPGKTVIRITTNPADDEGDMLDVENGDATPEKAPGWVARRRADGHVGPLVYCAESNRQPVTDAFAAANVPMPGLFIAAYPGVGPELQQPTDIGHQFASNNDYDTSVVIDYLPGIDPAPTPKPPTGQENAMTSPLFVFKPGQQDVVWTHGGKLLHGWVGVGGQGGPEDVLVKAGVNMAGQPPAVVIPDQEPKVRIDPTNNQCQVTVVDANGNDHLVWQGVNESAWHHRVWSA